MERKESSVLFARESGEFTFRITTGLRAAPMQFSDKMQFDVHVSGSSVADVVPHHVNCTNVVNADLHWQLHLDVQEFKDLLCEQHVIHKFG